MNRPSYLLVLLRHFESHIKCQGFSLAPEVKHGTLQRCAITKVCNTDEITPEYEQKKLWIESSQSKATWTVRGNFD